jgi:replicative DNA helicase
MNALGAVEPHVIANVEEEAALLGGLMHERSIIDRVADIVAPADFYEPLHSRIFETILRLHAEGKTASPVSLKPLFADDPSMKELGGTAYLVTIMGNSGVAVIGARDFARSIADMAKRRRLIAALVDVIGDARGIDIPIDKLVDAADSALTQALSRTNSVATVSIAQAFDDTMKAIEDEAAGLGPQGIKIAGLKDFNDLTGDLRRGELMYVGGRPSMGKAQPLNAMVLTHFGWRPMGDLAVGDGLASIDGQPSQVTGVFPQGVKQIYRVTFSDGRSTECCGEHLWKVRYRDWPEDRVLSTDKLREMLTRQRYKGRLSIDRINGEWGEHRDVRIDPWLLGILIGDGCLCKRSIYVTSKDPEIVERVASLLPSGVSVVHVGRYDYRLSTGRKGVSNPLKDALRDMGLVGTQSHNKFIPDAYQMLDRESRLALLQGLMDSDGWAEKHNVIRFSTASERLAADVCRLVRSLGGICSIRERSVSYSYKGEKKAGKASFTCRIRLDDGSEAFTLQRKRERCSTRSYQRTVRLSIASIEPTRTAEAQCISVSHPSHLYVTDGFVVTHNTALSLRLALGAAENGHGTALISLEMRSSELATRAMSDLVFEYGESCPSFEHIRKGNLGPEYRRQLAEARERITAWPLLITDPPTLNIGRLAMEIRRQRRRLALQGHSLDLVIVDYLGLLKGDPKAKRFEEVGEISRTLKQIAKECDVAMVVLAQLNRECEKREDKRPMLSDLRDAGDIEQDADHVLFVYRDEYYLERTEPNPTDKKREEWEIAMGQARDKMELILAKSRNGKVSKRTCHFFGKHQAVRESGYLSGSRGFV